MGRYAIIANGSHQYWVEENSVIEVERPTSADATAKELKLDQVLLVQDDGKTTIGKPYVANASVTCEVLGEIKQPKVISFKFRRRQGYRRKVGHRQILTRLKVKAIQAG